MKTKTRTPHEQHCLDNAAYFTAVRWKPLGNVTSTKVETLADARAIAAKHGDGRTMIYAVTADGRDAHIENA